jgi:hypothetical protein
LGLLVLFNACVFVALVKSDSVLRGDIAAALRDITTVIPAAVIVVFVGLLNGQLSPVNKARIVFGRWRDPLPGSEAFSRFMFEDPRIDVERLTSLCKPIPTEPDEQNARWYRLYKTVSGEPSVQEAHREFLFARDYTVLSYGMLLAFGIAALIWAPSWLSTGVYVGLLALQAIVAQNAARLHGRRLVCNVLATKSSEP